MAHDPKDQPAEKSWWIYSRFSTDMQSPHSCDDQERVCRHALARLGIDKPKADRDEAVRAGAVAGREGWARIMAEARAGHVAGVMFEELSRFSRDFFGGMAVLRELDQFAVKVADSKGSVIDLRSAMGQMYVSFGLVTSQQETQRLGERSKRGLHGKTLDRWSSGGRPAYGLCRVPEFSQTLLDPDDRPVRLGVRFTPDPVAGQIVLRIFRLYDDGLGLHEIARVLNEEHVPSRDAGRARRGKRGQMERNSGTWSAAAIGGILDNPIYAGIRVWNKNSRTGNKLPMSGKKQERPNPPDLWVEVKSFCEPIIDAGRWERVQLRRKATAARYEKRHTVNENRQFLLSGLIRCGSCGASFVIGAHKHGVKHYRCSFRASRGTVVCMNMVTVPQPDLEVRVKAVLDVIVKDPKKLGDLVADHNRRISEANSGQLAVVKALEARRQKLVEERDRFVEAIGFGVGAVKVLAGEVAKREKEIDELTPRISEAEALVQPLLIPRPAAVQDYIAGPRSIFSNDFAQDREFLARVLDGIYVQADGTLSLRFQGETLFAPAGVMGLDLGARGGDLGKARRDHEEVFRGLQKQLKRVGNTGGHIYAAESADNGPCYAHAEETGDAAFEAGGGEGAPGGDREKTVGVPRERRRKQTLNLRGESSTTQSTCSDLPWWLMLNRSESRAGMGAGSTCRTVSYPKGRS